MIKDVFLGATDSQEHLHLFTLSNIHYIYGDTVKKLLDQEQICKKKSVKQHVLYLFMT